MLDGKRVLIDASFGSNLHRQRFFDLADRFHVPVAMLVCRTDPTVVRKRLAERRGDASDADWAIYTQAAERWEPVFLKARGSVYDVENDGTPEDAVQRATRIISGILQ